MVFISFLSMQRHGAYVNFFSKLEGRLPPLLPPFQGHRLTFAHSLRPFLRSCDRRRSI